MKFLKYLIIIFISLTTSIKADSNKNLIKQLEDGGKLIFIRHAYAPGNGDPNNFNLNDCSTQRNLSKEGRKQAQLLGVFFKENKIQIDKVLSSEWCRCKETAEIAFEDFSTISFLNSFYSSKFAKNKTRQVEQFNKYIKKFKSYSFLERGSDERQFSSPGVDLPICSIMRSKYGTYPQYHTSLDNLNFISGKGLHGSFKILKKTLEIIEINFTYKNTYKYPCEPKLSNFNLRPPISFKKSYDYDKNLLNILLYADGKKDLIEISNKIKLDIFQVNEIVQRLLKAKLLKKI